MKVVNAYCADKTTQIMGFRAPSTLTTLRTSNRQSRHKPHREVLKPSLDREVFRAINAELKEFQAQGTQHNENIVNVDTSTHREH